MLYTKVTFVIFFLNMNIDANLIFMYIIIDTLMGVCVTIQQASGS